VSLSGASCTAPPGGDEDVSSSGQALTGSADDIAPPGSLTRTVSQARRDAAVRVLSDGGSCTGVLITPRLVLTGMHCVTDDGPYTVMFSIRRDGVREPGLPPPLTLTARVCVPHPLSTHLLSPIGCPAAAADAVHARLLVVDRVAARRGRGEDVRLLLVDLESGECTELARHRRTGGFDEYALASAPGAGQFVLAASDPRAMRHRLLHLEVGPEGDVRVRGHLPAAGHVIGQMVADRRGVSRAVERRRAATWEPVGTRWTELLPASPRGRGRIFRGGR